MLPSNVLFSLRPDFGMPSTNSAELAGLGRSCKQHLFLIVREASYQHFCSHRTIHVPVDAFSDVNGLAGFVRLLGKAAGAAPVSVNVLDSFSNRPVNQVVRLPKPETTPPIITQAVGN